MDGMSLWYHNTILWRNNYFCLFVCLKSQSTLFQMCWDETIACLLRLNQYLAEDKLPCSRIEHSASTGGETQTRKLSNGAKTRNRYNHLPHLTQDTNGKVTHSQLDTTNESQEVSPFPAGDHNAHMSRDMRFPTMWYLRPAKAQTSLHIHPVWSEPLLVAWIFYEY